MQILNKEFKYFTKSMCLGWSLVYAMGDKGHKLLGPYRISWVPCDWQWKAHFWTCFLCALGANSYRSVILFPHNPAHFSLHKFYTSAAHCLCFLVLKLCWANGKDNGTCSVLCSLVAIFLLSVQGLLQTSPLCCGEHRPDFDVDNKSLGILWMLVVSMAIRIGHSV